MIVQGVDEMYNDKILYYRKKNMLTQEELAEKLCVSRQTITKWEKGIISPGLEYLIDLSRIFGITIDRLIKEDDCFAEEGQKVDTNHLIHFLVKAKKSTYAAKSNKIEAAEIDAHEYAYHEDTYQYYDTFYGSLCFSGQEKVYESNHICWIMNYCGKVLNDHFNGDFLKEALLQVDEQRPFRGPEIYARGDYTYLSRMSGDSNDFQGTEEIYDCSRKIYEGLYHGGRIK